MPSCVVKLCHNNTTRNKKESGITYHQFPADPIICDRWIAIIRLSREESWWKPGKYSVICSTHFNESDLYITKAGLKRLCNGAIPQKGLFLSSTLPDNIRMNGVPSTSAPVDNHETAEPSSGNESPLDFPDIDDYIVDSPIVAKLKKELRRKTILQLKHSRIIKTLREKIRRLKKGNRNLRLSHLKNQKHFIKT